MTLIVWAQASQSLEDRMFELFPQWMKDDSVGISLAQGVLLAAVIVAGMALGVILQQLLLRVGGYLTSRTRTEWDEKLLDIVPGPGRVLISVLCIRLLLPLAHLNEHADNVALIVIRTLLIIAGTWLVLRFINVGAAITEQILTRNVTQENLKRSMHTWIDIPARILRFLLVLVALAVFCFQFEAARRFGWSLVGTAGLAGIALGLAAQKVLGNIFSGIQLAFSQPMKIGDVVIAEGEWGRIEEIGITHVVVNIWDQRRLVLPVSYFLDKPFQNWTRESEELLGTVYVYADYTIDLEKVKKELKRIVKKEGKDLWDERTAGVIVTNLTNDYVELRCLVSAKNSSDIWNLRCLVREKMLAWLQTTGKLHLPLRRVEIQSETTEEGKGF